MSTWMPVDTKTEKLVNGQTYRATLWLPLPDTIDARNSVVNVVKNADKFVHQLPEPLQFGYSKFKITKVETGASVASATNVRLRPWPIRVEFTYNYSSGGGASWAQINPTTSMITVGDTGSDNFLGVDDAAEAFAIIAGLIAFATIGITIISRSLEKLVKPLAQTIFNPGVLVIGLLIVFLVFKGRKLGHG